MQFVNPYRFGIPTPIYVNNTFIGGVASAINTPAQLSAKLQNYPSGTGFDEANIQNFTIVGNDIECYIGVDYQIANYGLYNNNAITYYFDEENYCKKIGIDNFKLSENIKEIRLKGIIESGSGVFGSRNKIRQYIFPNLTTLNSTYGYFQDNSDAIFYAPNYKPIGVDATNTNIFVGTSNFRLYTHLDNATINGGNPDGEITALINTNYGKVSYIQNFTSPNSIVNLSAGSIYATAIELLFTEPTGNVNLIDFYEVYVNGRYNNRCTYGNVFAINLKPNSVNSIEVKPVDIYYNRSTSNIVSQLTIVSFIIPISKIISYYKMENNVFDAIGTNNGTANSITYNSSLIGQGAKFLNSSASNIIAGNSTAFAINGNSTISFSYNPTAWANSCIFEYGSYTSWGTLVQSTNGTLEFFFSPHPSGSYLSFVTFFKIPLNKTTIITLVRDYTNGNFSLYLNNELCTCYKMAFSQSKQSTGNFLIGRGYRGSVTATIDEFIISNYALNDAERSEINAKLLSGQSLI